MITLKMVIRPNRQKADGTWPVNLRISFQRKSSYIATPYFVTKAQINKAFEIKALPICATPHLHIRHPLGQGSFLVHVLNFRFLFSHPLI